MINEMIDIDFPGLSPESAFQVLLQFSGCAKAVERSTCIDKEMDWHDVITTFLTMKLYRPLLTVHLRDVRISTIHFSHMLIMAEEEEAGTCAIEASFTINDVPRTQWPLLVGAIQDFATRTALAVNTGIYYAGIEPGHDSSTRLFTGSTTGPVTIDVDVVHFF